MLKGKILHQSNYPLLIEYPDFPFENTNANYKFNKYSVDLTTLVIASSQIKIDLINVSNEIYFSVYDAKAIREFLSVSYADLAKRMSDLKPAYHKYKEEFPILQKRLGLIDKLISLNNILANKKFLNIEQEKREKKEFLKKLNDESIGLIPDPILTGTNVKFTEPSKINLPKMSQFQKLTTLNFFKILDECCRHNVILRNLNQKVAFFEKQLYQPPYDDNQEQLILRNKYLFFSQLIFPNMFAQWLVYYYSQVEKLANLGKHDFELGKMLKMTQKSIYDWKDNEVSYIKMINSFIREREALVIQITKEIIAALKEFIKKNKCLAYGSEWRLIKFEKVVKMIQNVIKNKEKNPMLLLNECTQTIVLKEPHKFVKDPKNDTKTTISRVYSFQNCDDDALDYYLPQFLVIMNLYKLTDVRDNSSENWTVKALLKENEKAAKPLQYADLLRKAFQTSPKLYTIEFDPISKLKYVLDDHGFYYLFNYVNAYYIGHKYSQSFYTFNF